MTRKTKWSLAAVAVTITVAVGAILLHVSHDDSAIKCVCEWARLAPFPRSAANLTVRTSGSMFTREFDVEFDGPLKDINDWIALSPGTTALVPEKAGSRRHYSIIPGGGAEFAELTVDDATGHVHIHAYWS